MRYVRISGSGCWRWKWSRNPAGYGLVYYAGKQRLAHRVAYCLHNKVTLDSIEGFVVRHKCDTRCCVNPEHLELGTQSENMKDAHVRGRMAKGEQHHKAKLTEEAVLFIREAYAEGMSQKSLADKYGVALLTISNVIHRRTWANI